MIQISFVVLEHLQICFRWGVVHSFLLWRSTELQHLWSGLGRSKHTQPYTRQAERFGERERESSRFHSSVWHLQKKSCDHFAAQSNFWKALWKMGRLWSTDYVELHLIIRISVLYNKVTFLFLFLKNMFCWPLLYFIALSWERQVFPLEFKGYM